MGKPKRDQELISLKFSVNPNENEKKVKEIYNDWKANGKHKDMVFQAILSFVGYEPVTDTKMLGVLVDLADSLQVTANRLESMEYQQVQITDGGKTIDFDDDFKDTMLGAWE